MTPGQQAKVVNMRAEGVPWKQCAEEVGIGYHSLRSLFSQDFNNLKHEIVLKKAEIQRKVEQKHGITREDLIDDLVRIKRENRKKRPGTAIKAIENIGRMIGAYAEDNKQKGPGSLAEAVLAIAGRRTRRIGGQTTKQVRSSIVGEAGASGGQADSSSDNGGYVSFEVETADNTAETPIDSDATASDNGDEAIDNEVVDRLDVVQLPPENAKAGGVAPPVEADSDIGTPSSSRAFP